jgi:hypothetical protein
MIKRDWLLGVGLLSGGIGLGLDQQPALAQDAGGEIGKVAAVKPDAFGAAPSAPEQVLAIGAGLVENEKIRTSPDGTANVIFADRSTLTVGKGSEVTLDKFVYDPSSKSGGLAIGLAAGTLRFVGGQLSKSGDVQVKTPTATMTVRGGIALFSFPPGQVGYAVFLYGKELKDVGSGQSIYRPGFAFEYPADGGPPKLVPLTDELLAQILQNFNTKTGLGGTIPDEDLAQFEQQIGDPNFQQDISNLRDQIEGTTNRDNPILDTLRSTPVTIPTSNGYYN